MGDPWPVVWEGQLVGVLEDPKHQLFGCVGRWVPASPPSEEFATALGRLPELAVIVSGGNVRALIEQPPAESGELSVLWIP